MTVTVTETEGIESATEPWAPARLTAGDATIDIDSGTLLVGSGSTAEWRLDDRSISRVHASFEVIQGGVRVKDLGSRNGTFYLGARIETAIVPIGGSIQLGRCLIHVLPQSQESAAEMGSEPPGALIGVSPKMRRLFAQVRKIALSDSTLLIEGPSGAGKDVVARTIHELSRADAPWVVFDCGTTSPNLIEAELFGVAKGAFSGADRDRVGLLETAANGTLLIDGPSHLPLELQPKLLRILESREFRRVGENKVRRTDARFIATSQPPLEDLVAAGKFRSDLFFRLSTIRLSLAPLAERREDIPLLAKHFARELNMTLPPSTLAALQCHRWPGNVRELRSAIERTLLKLESAPGPKSPDASQPSFLEARDAVLAEFEREFLSTLLAHHRGNVSAAAREAKVARSFFYRLLEKHQLS